MDESDIERAQNTETMLLASRLQGIQRSVAAPPRISADCEECERPIPAGRLRAMPGARYCVDCQEAHEGGARAH